MLSQVVLAVTGHDLGAFLAAEVFEPLGLDMVMDPIAVIEDKAVSYERVEMASGRSPTVAGSRLGAGAIQTTPSQLVAWAAQYWEPTIGAPTIDAERFEAAVDAARGMRYGAGIIELRCRRKVGRMLTHDGALGRVRHHIRRSPRHTTSPSPSPARGPTRCERLLRHQLDIDLLTAWIGSN